MTDVRCSRRTRLALAVVFATGGAAAADPGGAGSEKPAATPPPYAVIGPARIAIGGNVLIRGYVGTRYGLVEGELDAGGDPLAMQSDFRGLDDELDATLDALDAEVVRSDVNGDNRLRVDHPVEGANLSQFPDLVDYDGNGDVDGFDLFLDHYDANRDGGVSYFMERSPSLVQEFQGMDDELARLIDEATPDRNGDGRVTREDTILGYRDGVLDGRDAYAKVRGGLTFAVARAAWEDARGTSWQQAVRGAIRPEVWEDAARFEVGEDDLPVITFAMFDDDLTWLETQVPPAVPRDPGDPPVDPALLVHEALAAGSDAEFIPAVDGDWEGMPFGSDAVLDHYKRPVYRDYTFHNVRISTGNNAVFENCTFVGVTYIESEPRCTHRDWNLAGAVMPVDDGQGGIIYVLRFPDLPPPPPDHICIDGYEVRDTRGYSNNIRFHDCTFLGSIAGARLEQHTHWRNVVQLTGRTRAFLEVDEVDPPTLTDAAGHLLIEYLATLTDEEREGLAASTLLLPHWSVILRGVEDDPPTVLMRGRVVAGVLEVTGALDVHGTVVSTYHPVAGEGPLFYGGHPSAFVTSLGRFAPRGSGHGGAITLWTDPDVPLRDDE